jgi:hypothetical protein
MFTQKMNNRGDNQDLINEMGEEAYYAAKKLGAEMQKKEEADFVYWRIYDIIRADNRKKFEQFMTPEETEKSLDKIKSAINHKAKIHEIFLQLVEIEKNRIQKPLVVPKLSEQKKTTIKKVQMEWNALQSGLIGIYI